MNITIFVLVGTNVFITVKSIFRFFSVFPFAKYFTVYCFPNCFWLINVMNFTQGQFRSFWFFLQFWLFNHFPFYLSRRCTSWWFWNIFQFWSCWRCHQIWFFWCWCEWRFHRFRFQSWFLRLYNNCSSIWKWFWSWLLRKFWQFWLLWKWFLCSWFHLTFDWFFRQWCG